MVADAGDLENASSSSSSSSSELYKLVSIFDSLAILLKR